MDLTSVLIALVTLAAGVAIGVLWAGRRAAVQHAAEQDRGRAAVDELSGELRAAHAEVAGLQATLQAERAAASARAEELATLQAAQEARIRETFGAIAGEALNRNNEAFVALAESRLTAARAASESDLAQRQQAIDALVGPMRESLEKVQHQVTTAERDRAGAYATLLEQVKAMSESSAGLRTETAQLVSALRAPQVRGRWGELQLERAVEAAGMTEHVDYVTQATDTTVDGTVRPDMVVRLAGGKNVVVDSKVAFSGYLEAMEAKDEQTRNARLKAHARHLRTHVDSLAAKSYWERFSPSPEFVVCFVPADSFLDAALRADPTLMEHAFERNVVLATPSTLIALLRTVAYTWRQEALAANAAEVNQLGRELYQRLATMGAHMDKLGRSLNAAVGSYNQTVSSLESRVLVSARRMQELKVVEADDRGRTSMKAPEQITETARSTQAPELTEQRVVKMPKNRMVAGQTDLLSALRDASGSES